MNISKADRERFLELVESRYVGTAKDFLDGVFDLSYIKYKIKTRENSSYTEYSFIMIYTTDSKKSSGIITFRDFRRFMKKDDVELIYRVLNNYDENFRYVYTCRDYDIYAVIGKRPTILALWTDIILGIKYPPTLYLENDGADCSDEIWGYIENDHKMLGRFLKIYLETPDRYSAPMQKRLQYDYENIIDDSDKLLLELGEELT